MVRYGSGDLDKNIKKHQAAAEERANAPRLRANKVLGLPETRGPKIGSTGASAQAYQAKVSKKNKKKPSTVMAPTSEEEQAMKRKSMPGEEVGAKKTLLGV